ncbi:phosphoenolpyruvate--protein phosphotransferase [Fusibacter ferrireducens]
MMRGIGASDGYGIGKVVVKKELSVPKKAYIEDVEAEIQKIENAFIAAEKDLESEYEQKVETLGKEHGEIFKAHIAMLQDPELKKTICDLVEKEKVTATYSTQMAIDQFVAVFQSMDNEYFRERALDIKDIGVRILKKLLNISDSGFEGEGLVIVAKDLTPSDTAKIDKKQIEGFITAIGGSTSHSAIIARTLGVPAIMGVSGIVEAVKDGDIIIVDGFTGDVFINPTKELLHEYELKKVEYEAKKKELMIYKEQPSVTKDGHHIEIGANIASPDDVEPALENGAEGVGLFRSEFIFMNRTEAPNETEQYIAYKAVLEGMGKRPVVIRTLDAGGDKKIPYLNIPEEMNPFLGYRAIRYCLVETDLFKVQLRALMRASVFGNLKIMFPMISSVEEIRNSKKILDEVKSELDAEGIAYDPNVEVGIMIEIPAAAVISDVLAKEVDFFSIGTNDLIQYTTAVDRMNENIKALYTPYHPAVLRLVHTTIKNGNAGGIWVGMCGSVAGNPLIFPILIAMGLHEFSMSPGQILKSRKIASLYTLEYLNEVLAHVLSLGTAEEVETYLKATFTH